MTTTDTTKATTDTSEKTITVEGHFGVMKTLNKADFQGRWTASVTDLYSVTNDMADHNAVVAIVSQVKEMAGRRFDYLHARAEVKANVEVNAKALKDVRATAKG